MAINRQRDPALRLMGLAERNPRRAGMYALRMAAQGGLDARNSLAAGWALLHWERFEAADPLIAAALAQPDALGSATLSARRAHVLLQQLRGAGPELQRAWEAHIEVCRDAGNELEELRAQCEQIAHLNLIGRPRVAQALALQLAPLVAAHGAPSDAARYRHVAGVAATNCGDLHTAQTLLDAAVAGFAALGFRAEYARACFSRAWLWQRREQFAEAERDLQHALAIFAQLDLPFRVALCRRDLGLVARYRGDYGQAIALTISAREQFRALGRADRVASCDFNLGAVAHMSGLYDLAITAYRAAEQAYRAAGDDAHLLVAGRNQALALGAQGNAAAALARIDALMPLVADLGDQVEAAEVSAVRGGVLRSLGRLAEATAELQVAHDRFAALGNGPAAAECRLDLGWIALEQDADTEALEHLHAALAALPDRPAHAWRAQYGLGRISEQRGDRAAARAYYMAAVNIVAQIRRRIATEHASSGIFSLARRLHDDALRLAADQGDYAHVLVLAELQRGLAFAAPPSAVSLPPGLHAALTAAGNALRRAADTPSDATHLSAAQKAYLHARMQLRNVSARSEPAPPLDLASVRRRLISAYGTDWTILLPVFTATELLHLGVTSDTLFLARTQLDPQVQRLITHATHPDFQALTYRDLARLRNPDLPAWATLDALGDVLLPAWLRSRLTPDHRLLIVPAGPLHGLAWAALRLDGSWLCEQAIIELLPALGMAPAQPLILPPSPALLISAPDVGARAAPLPAAQASVELVERLWPGACTHLSGAAATCAAIQRLSAEGALERYGLLHIAGHAQLGAVDGLLAHIKLTDADLLLDNILQLRLQRALVVLAACEGGAGATLPGDEVLGLSRALVTVGAAGVVASLWPIYDRSALALLEPFYRRLAAGVDAATALTLAQRDLINGTDGPALLRSPAIWGGFGLTVASV